MESPKCGRQSLLCFTPSLLPHAYTHQMFSGVSPSAPQPAPHPLSLPLSPYPFPHAPPLPILPPPIYLGVLGHLLECAKAGPAAAGWAGPDGAATEGGGRPAPPAAAGLPQAGGCERGRGAEVAKGQEGYSVADGVDGESGREQGGGGLFSIGLGRGVRKVKGCPLQLHAAPGILCSARVYLYLLSPISHSLGRHRIP